MTTAGPWSPHAVDIYMKEVGHYPLLCAQEERELATLYERGRSAQLRLQQEPGLSVGERSRLQREIARGHSARRRLIESNLRLVIKLIGKYAHCGLPYGDLVQEGNIGLIHAVERFDYHRGVRFATYAGWWIKQSVLRAAANHGRTIRLPVHMVDVVRTVQEAELSLHEQLRRVPTIAEIAEVSGLDEEKILVALNAPGDTVSLDRKVGDDGDAELGDFVHDESSEDPFTRVADASRREHLVRALGTLDEREQIVLVLRYGLDAEPPRTLSDVGSTLGITRERVRQIETRALGKLRHPSTLYDLESLL